MTIIVCLHAPPSEPGGSGLGRSDAYALAQGLALADPAQESVTAVLAGTSHESGPLQRALVAGAARAVRIGGDDYASVDFHTLGQALAAGIKRLGAESGAHGRALGRRGPGRRPRIDRAPPRVLVPRRRGGAGAGRAARRRGRRARRRSKAPSARRSSCRARDRRRAARPSAALGSHREPERGGAADARRSRGDRRPAPHRAARQARAGVARHRAGELRVRADLPF